jgi:primosomal protein N'
MFLEAVVPDHSLDSKGFTYFVPDHLRGLVRRGCVVEVPFGDELVPAVVTESDAPPPDRTEAKSVVSILVADPVVHEYQIEAAYAISRRYFVFLHTALSFFLPTPVFRRFLKTGKGYCTWEGGNSGVPSLAGPRTGSAVANPGKQSAGRETEDKVNSPEAGREGPLGDVCGSRTPSRPAEGFG